MKNVKENAMKIVFFMAAITSVLAVLLICVFLFSNGIPAIRKIGLLNFLGGTKWSPTSEPASYGILPMILGSVYVTAGAVVIGVPIGIMTAVYLARYAGKKMKAVVTPAVNLLAGVPSVVFGFFGLMVIVPVVRNIFGTGNSMLTASILLGMMILPTIVNVSRSAIEAVPNSYYEGALALGATHERSVFRTIVPAGKSGILAGVILGIGRAIGETMAVIMVAGNQPRIPDSLLKGVRTMTANIVLEMGYATDLHREALIATGVVLFVFILIINLSFSVLKERKTK